MKTRDDWKDAIVTAAYFDDLKISKEMDALLDEIMALQGSAQQSMHQAGLTPAQKEEVRQMIQSALDTGSA